VQEADRARLPVIRPEGIGADELGQAVGMMCRGLSDGAHFVQDHGDATLCKLPGGFAPGEPAADDMNWIDRHGACVGEAERPGNHLRAQMKTPA